MKENVLDVLMYLFETYVDTDEEPEADQNELRDELSRAGFTDSEIERALDWLDGLTDHQESIAFHAQTSHGLRVYNDFEQERLDASCRGYIAYLEQIGILSPEQREILVDRLLALEPIRAQPQGLLENPFGQRHLVERVRQTCRTQLGRSAAGLRQVLQGRFSEVIEYGHGFFNGDC